MVSTIETIGKPLVSLVNGKQLGTVCNIEIKNQKVTRLVALNDDIDAVEYLLVPTSNVHAFGGEAVTIKSHIGLVETEEVCCPRILGTNAINQEGEKSFTVADIIFDEKNYKVWNLTGVDGTKHAPNSIATYGDSFITLKGKVRMRAAKNCECSEGGVCKCGTTCKCGKEKQLKINSQNLIVARGNVNSPVIYQHPQNERLVIAADKIEPVTVPSKIVCDYDFLLGRRLTQNLLGKNGRTIIAANEKLTNQNLSAAISSGNLNFVLKNNMPL